ncbi:MAG: hypothetical protein COA41_01915 [Sphingopyxis sp.]|nr:MAG: hypothetical protein COA41_01915 [Sphingopyxis sp.]
MRSFFNRSLLGVISSLVFAISLFVVYRLGFAYAGAPVFGTWVIIQSILVIVRLPEAGIGINLTRDIAIDFHANPNMRLAPYIVAGFLISVLPIILIGLAAAYPVLWVIEFFFDSPLNSSDILNLIFINVVFASIYATGTMLAAIMEGIGKLSRKYYYLIVSNISLAVFAFPLISNFGIFGVALNYLLTAIILASLAGLYLANRSVKSVVCEQQTTRKIVGRIWKQSVTVSSMALLRMSFEPWSKFVIGLTGGLAAVAYADLAFKITNQVRNTVQSACQPLLTYGARNERDDPKKQHVGFGLAQQVIVKINIFLVTLMVIATPVVAIAGIGRMVPQFALLFIILTVANGINSLGVVGYYYSVSAGKMMILLQIHGLMLLINLLGGTLAILTNSLELAVFSYALMLIYAGKKLGQLWIGAGHQTWLKLLTEELPGLVVMVGSILLTFWLYRSPAVGNSLTQLSVIAVIACVTVTALFTLQNCVFARNIFSKLKV